MELLDFFFRQITLLKTNKAILAELRAITKDKAHWQTAIDDVAARLGERYSAEVKAKALWLLGEMGLQYPAQAQSYIEQIAGYLDSGNPKLRERAVNALGRIGRADKALILSFFDSLMHMRSDTSDAVRLAFVCACENVARFIFSGQIAPLKNTASLLIANVAYQYMRYCASMQQLPKLTLCSVAAF